jgi:hypothetical protein
MQDLKKIPDFEFRNVGLNRFMLSSLNEKLASNIT